MLDHILCYVNAVSNDWRTERNGTEERNNLHNKDQQDALFSLNLFQ
jgi:hypothetical protein